MKFRFKLEVSADCSSYDTFEEALAEAEKWWKWGHGYTIRNSVTREIIVRRKTPIYTED
jgi:hypothetical protein